MQAVALVNRTASRLDISILVGVAALCAIGLIVMYSAGGEDTNLLTRQAARVLVAVAAMLFFASVPSSLLCKYSPHFFGVALGLLLLVLLVGTVTHGSRRWLQLGIVSFQPAEVAKLAVPMMVAWILTQPRVLSRRVLFLISGFIIIPPVLLVLQQPDLGTAILIAASGAVAIYLGGLGWRWVAGAIAGGTAATPIVYYILADYQRVRVDVLFDPYKYATGEGYQIIQSQIAIGSGGVTGKGWLNGSQSQLEFIPERQTDFVFSVFAEEFGLIGSLVVLGIYSFLVWRCMLIAYKARYDYARIVAGSIGVMLFFHLYVNVGMVSGVVPVVGVPLPLISYGGTSMVSLLGGIGIVMGAQHVED